MPQYDAYTVPTLLFKPQLSEYFRYPKRAMCTVLYPPKKMKFNINFQISVKCARWHIHLHCIKKSCSLIRMLCNGWCHKLDIHTTLLRLLCWCHKLDMHMTLLRLLCWCELGRAALDHQNILDYQNTLLRQFACPKAFRKPR